MSIKSIALIGEPNCGKTTLFNWLTQLKNKTVNYPGSTVEYATGAMALATDTLVNVIDTPGTYSLSGKKPDEQITQDILLQKSKDVKIDLVIMVVDATQIKRHLFLFKQVQSMGYPIVVAFTMIDLIRKSNVQIKLDKLSQKLNVPVLPIDGLLGGGVIELKKEIQDQLAKSSPFQITPFVSWGPEKTKATYEAIDQIYYDVVDTKNKTPKYIKNTDLIDSVLLHPFWGTLSFLAIMALLFTSIFWLAAPLMDQVDTGFSELATTVYEMGHHALWADFIANGIITSFGAVFVFVPQILILFLGIGLLEDTGYLARAAAIVDKVFSKFGLNGRSFVPILSGHACAVPAIMAARNIGSWRERWLTIFIIPLMTCSARLPVYSLLLAFLFIGQPSWKPGLALTGLYVLSIIVGIIAAAIAHKILAPERKSFFMMELPLYRRPRFMVLLINSLHRTKGYIMRAGPVIFVLALVIWVGTNFPNYRLENETEKLQTSWAGQLGHVMEPVFEPMGVDWRVGLGLISAFAAREVFVSSLAVVFNLTGVEDDSLQATLLQNMKTAVHAVTGEPLFNFASVLGLILFFMISLQCISTTSIAQREMASWKFAIFQLVAFNLIGYVLAVATYQLLS